MHVVAAGVGDSGHGGAEVLVDEVVDGQGIDIGAQPEGQRSIADLAHDPGAFEAPRLQAGGLEAGHDLVGGLAGPVTLVPTATNFDILTAMPR